MKKAIKFRFGFVHLILPFLVLSLASLGIYLTLRNYNKVNVNAAAPFVFTALGDYGSSSNTSANLDAIATSGSSFHLALGDLSYGGSETSWCDYVKSHVGPTFPFELVSGNHEDDGPDGNINNFTSCLPDRIGNITGSYGKEYYFDYQGVGRFIMITPNLVIDGQPYDYTVGSAHYTWLESAIDGARASGLQWVVVGMHKTCITVAGSRTCDTTTDLLNLLVSKKVDLVLQAHDHLYLRSKQLAHSIDCTSVPVNGSFNASCIVDDGADNAYVKGAGTVFMTIGSGGNDLYSVNTADPEIGYYAKWMGNNIEPRYGFGKFTLSDSGIAAEFVGTTSGSTFVDSFTINASGVPPSPTPTPTPTPTPAPIACAAPTILAKSDSKPTGAGTVKFNWVAVGGATQYKVQRQNSDGTWSTRQTSSKLSFSGSDSSSDPNWQVFVSAGSCSPLPGAPTVFDP